jgi:hypothetical protein
VSAASGGALVRGFYVNNPATTTMAVPTQSAGDRVDRLALRLDRTASVAADWLKPIILQGTSGSATPPALAATDNASWDLPIARWTTKADTTLTGLVDERLALGGSFMVFKSANRPSASPPRLGYETDTGRLLLANGSAWAAVIDDTGWVNVPVVGNWAAGGFTPKIRRIGNIVAIRGNVVRTKNDLLVSDEDSPVLQVAAPFLPSVDVNYMGWTRDGPCRIWIQASGAGHVAQKMSKIAVGYAVYIDKTYVGA